MPRGYPRFCAFGDRGSFVGNEDLLPETGISFDAGVSIDTRSSSAGITRLLAELTYFEARIDDLIVAVPYQRATRSVNVAGAIRLAKELGPGHVIVTLLCDSAMRYRARLFNREFLAGKGLELPDWLNLD